MTIDYPTPRRLPRTPEHNRDGKRIAILATDGVEEVGLTRPRDAVTAEGAQVDVVSIDEGELKAMNHDIEPASKIRRWA